MNDLAKSIDGNGDPTIRSSADNGSITIADTGVGMTPEVQARIFEPFFTTRDAGEGSEFVVTLPVGLERTRISADQADLR